jgi:uncharacterized protein (TIGR00290 family)
MKKSYFNWSTGKDSALALYKILQQKEYTVEKLITSVNSDFGRVSMHGLREELLDLQVQNLGFPLQKIHFPGDVTMSLYDKIMKENMQKIQQENFEYAVFGDVFLEDLKAYRDAKLAEVGLQGVYPLWKQDTKALLNEFLDLGFKAITVCVNAKLLDKSFVGRVLDEQFIADLPEDVDVCGENGEFHTFVFDGPVFKKPVAFEIGEKVLRTYRPNSEATDDSCSNDSKNKNEDCCQDKTAEKSWDTGFWYCDLLPEKVI